MSDTSDVEMAPRSIIDMESFLGRFALGLQGELSWCPGDVTCVDERAVITMT